VKSHGVIPSIDTVGNAFLSAIFATATIPAPMNSQAISGSVQTVTPAVTRNNSHDSRLDPRVLLASFHALLAMMAITAAPAP